MKAKLAFALAAITFLSAAATALRADQLEMQNGDRYQGDVLSVSGTNVVFESELLGKITLPRKQVARMAFGTNAVAPKPTTEVARIPTVAIARTNPPAPAALVIRPATPSTNTNTDLSAALRNMGGNTDFIREIREKMLAGSPEASGKYDAMVGDLMSGKMDMAGLRRQAAASAEQLRTLKRDLGPEADETLDGYLQVLESFLKQSGTGTTIESPAP